MKESTEREEAMQKYPKWWRGLFPLLVMMIIANIDILVLNDYIVHRYTTAYGLNSTSPPMAREICLNESSSSSSSSPAVGTTTSRSFTTTTTSFSNLVQSLTARLNVYIYLAATVPAILTSIFIGANCDRIGRKCLIALPFVGKSLRYLILLLSNYYAWPD